MSLVVSTCRRGLFRSAASHRDWNYQLPLPPPSLPPPPSLSVPPPQSRSVPSPQSRSVPPPRSRSVSAARLHRTPLCGAHRIHTRVEPRCEAITSVQTLNMAANGDVLLSPLADGDRVEDDSPGKMTSHNEAGKITSHTEAGKRTSQTEAGKRTSHTEAYSASLNAMDTSRLIKPQSAVSAPDPGGETAPSTPTNPPQFYRRQLPPACIAFSSPQGKQLFREALESGHMEAYFSLAAQFRTQDEPAYCGVSTIVMVLNTLEVDPGRVWKGVWRWYHEEMLDCCVPLSVVAKTGIDLEQFACLASCNTLDVTVTRPEDFTFEEFREWVREGCRQDREILVASYSRRALGQSGDGHFSPLAGYHPASDHVLILDTARFKYPPHWVSLDALWEAMKWLDIDTGKSRGLVKLKKSGRQPMIMFRLSSLWISTLVDGTGHAAAPRVHAFIDGWSAWLEAAPLGTAPTCRDVMTSDAVQTFLRGAVARLLTELAAFWPGEAVLSTQSSMMSGSRLSRQHACALTEILRSLEACALYAGVSAALPHLAAHQCEGGLAMSRAGRPEPAPAELGAEPAEGVNCCSAPPSLQPMHFLAVLLLMWPFQRTGSPTNGGVLSVLVRRQMKELPGLLQNEVEQLQAQLHSMLGYNLRCCSASCTNSASCLKLF